MEKTDILFDVQKRLIQDLTKIVSTVQEEYGHRLNNAWVFDYLDAFLRKLQPARVGNVEYNKSSLETVITETIDNNIGKIQSEIPEINKEDVYKLVDIAGDLYDLIYSRAQKELASLESKASKYNSSEELVQSEFDKVKAFRTKREHQKWMINFSDGMNAILTYVEQMGESIANKTGLIWKGKLLAAKRYLKTHFDVKLSLSELAQDVNIIREAIIKNYEQYENQLIETRYAPSKR